MQYCFAGALELSKLEMLDWHNIYKFFPISIFSQIRSEGSSNFLFFPNSRVQIILGKGGGQKDCGLFPLFGTFFISIGPLTNKQANRVTLSLLKLLIAAKNVYKTLYAI